jgi:tetratricopeptide (TPR) repeat protein
VSERYRVTSLDAVEPLPGPGTLRWLPIRHELGIGAFGTNAYVAENAGDDVVEPHTEEGTGHEEVYFVARGAATFTLDGEEVKAPAGTYVFLPDPAVRRHAVADEPGTTVLSFGGWRDRPFAVSGWEARFRATAIRERDPQRARELYEEALAREPDGPWAHYDLACWHALYGDAAEARRLLERAIELGGEEVRAQAAEDPDLARLREGD